MDREKGRELHLREVIPTPEIPVDEQIEPWGWHDKAPPSHIVARLRLYRLFLERLGNGDAE